MTETYVDVFRFSSFSEDDTSSFKNMMTVKHVTIIPKMIIELMIIFLLLRLPLRDLPISSLSLTPNSKELHLWFLLYVVLLLVRNSSRFYRCHENRHHRKKCVCVSSESSREVVYLYEKTYPSSLDFASQILSTIHIHTKPN